MKRTVFFSWSRSRSAASAGCFVYPMLSGERHRGAAYGERRARRTGWRSAPRAQRRSRGASRSRARSSSSKRGKRPPSGCRSSVRHRAGRPHMDDAPLHDHRRCFGLLASFACAMLVGTGLLAGAGFGFCGGRRASVLGIVIPEESAVNRVSSRRFRKPSTSSFAASRPACRCSTASNSSPPRPRSPSAANFAGSSRRQTIGIPLGEACHQAL